MAKFATDDNTRLFTDSHARSRMAASAFAASLPFTDVAASTAMDL